MLFSPLLTKTFLHLCHVELKESCNDLLALIRGTGSWHAHGGGNPCNDVGAGSKPTAPRDEISCQSVYFPRSLHFKTICKQATRHKLGPFRTTTYFSKRNISEKLLSYPACYCINLRCFFQTLYHNSILLLNGPSLILSAMRHLKSVLKLGPFRTTSNFSCKQAARSTIHFKRSLKEASINISQAVWDTHWYQMASIRRS